MILRLFSLFVLFLITVSPIATAVLPPDVREANEAKFNQSSEKARKNAPEVFDVYVHKISQRKGNTSIDYIAEAEVLKVIRTHIGVKTEDVIRIKFTDISIRARKHNERIKREKIFGPGFKPVLHLLKAGEQARIFVKSISGNPHVLTLAAGIVSFEPIKREKQLHAPCIYHSIGPVTSEIRNCSKYKFDSSEKRLNDTIKNLNEYLTSSAYPDEPNTLEKQQRALTASNLAWKDYRSNTCQLVYLKFFGGSFAPIHELDCLTQLTEERIQLLDRIFNGWNEEK